MIEKAAAANTHFSARIMNWTRAVIRSKVFWSVLVIKIVASCLFGSSYLTGLFIPFLEAFVADPTRNPYHTFWSRGDVLNFPYPAAMLYIMAFPRWLLSLVGLTSENENFLLFVYRIPLLLADLAILLVLCRWLRQKVKVLLWLYWASPVLFYISYLHGQLDAIPMALALLSAYFLFSRRPLASAILFGLAISAKTHMFLMLPFILVYLWQNAQRGSTIAKYLLISAAVFIILNLPFLTSSSFIGMVFLNPEQNKVGLAAISTGYQDLHFYIIPSVLTGLIIYSSHIHIRNRDLFLIFVGFACSIILLFVPPSQGWYFWVIPFFAYFYARIPYPYQLLIVALQGSYFLYFGLIPNSDFTQLLQIKGLPTVPSAYAALARRGWDPELFVNLAFTGLQTFLLLSSVVMYFRGIHVPQSSKLIARPFMLGVAGDSGSGKSTVSDSLQNLFGLNLLGVICGDDMHKWQRGHKRWSELTHLDPRANELHHELVYLKQLRRNKLIRRRHYDHDTGRFTDELPVNPRPVMILEGLHSFYLKPARDLFDLKIFMKPDHTLLLHRKVLRDMENRNYPREEVLASIRQRRGDSEKYIIKQEGYADIIISFMLQEEIPEDQIGNKDYEVHEWLRLSLSNAYFLDPVVSDLMDAHPGAVHHYYDENDSQVIEFDTPPKLEDIAALGEKHVKGLQQFGIYDPAWEGGWQGVIQLIASYCIFSDWEADNGI
ncbi:hypothetical protein [Martelella sp. HB161492]|uniref:hypothetical protein n=1 Tax=Martelella sp. HB161492 TaxID=2720726 RepID=UPI001590D570|nr:hypothetical protein [Martelella sp. HB161492]